MKVLVVEDDNETAAYVANGLKELGHTVDVAVDGREGLLLAAGVPYELMIIDRMLPEIDGLSIVRRIRIAGVETPVLFLTALGGVDDRSVVSMLAPTTTSRSPSHSPNCWRESTLSRADPQWLPW